MIGLLARWLFTRGAARAATAAAAEGVAATATTGAAATAATATAATAARTGIGTFLRNAFFGTKTRTLVTAVSADQLTGGHGFNAGKEFVGNKFNEAVEEKALGILQDFGVDPEAAKEKLKEFNETMKDLGLDGAMGPAMKAGALGWALGAVLPGDAWKWAVTFAAIAVAYHIIKNKLGTDFSAAATTSAPAPEANANLSAKTTAEPGVTAPALPLQEPEPAMP